MFRVFPRRAPAFLVSVAAAAPLLLLAAAAPSLGAGCAPAGGPRDKNLLSDLTPVAAGVLDVERMTDGVASREGDNWESDLTARVLSSGSSAVFDLGAERPIRCVLVQGDDNDTYHLAGSLDGAPGRHLGREPAARGAGVADAPRAGAGHGPLPAPDGERR